MKIPIEQRHIDVLISNGITNPIEHLKSVIDDYMKEYIKDIEFEKELLDLECLNDPINVNALDDLDLKIDGL